MSKGRKGRPPPIGDNDLAPLFLSGTAAKQLSADQYLEQFGPPYGPCGVACDCIRCQAYREGLRRYGPAPKVLAEYDFKKIVENIINNEPRPEWRALIKNSTCFAKLWYDEEDESTCDELDCDLRDLCQATWNTVKGGEEVAKEPLKILKKKKLPIRRKVGRPPGRKPKVYCTGKYERVPYVSLERPVDLIAKEIYEHLGMPTMLPSPWFYGNSKTQAQINTARARFLETYGPGLFVAKRTSYHQYIFNGLYFMRFWVNSPGGGWVDLSKPLAKAVAKKGAKLEKVPASGKTTKHRFYTWRIYLATEFSVKRFKRALTSMPDLEYLFERSDDDKNKETAGGTAED